MNTNTPNLARAIANSPLALGNGAVRGGDYAAAIRHYLRSLQTTPALAKVVAGNLAMARHKYRAGRATGVRLHVAVCGWNLADDAARRVYSLAKLYETFAEVEIIGSLFPNGGRKIWEPIRDRRIAKYSFVVEDERRFLEQTIELIAAHPYDIVHLSNPRVPNIFFGILYKLIWNSKVLMDIDDEELVFVDEEIPISVDDYLEQHGQLPELKDLGGEAWTRLAVGLAKEFDGVTVSTPELQHRYGGEIIRRACDKKCYEPSSELKHTSREKFGTPKDKKVALCFGTARAHKGHLEAADAIATLDRTQRIATALDDTAVGKQMGAPGQQFFFTELFVAADAPRLQSIANSNNAPPRALSRALRKLGYASSDIVELLIDLPSSIRSSRSPKPRIKVNPVNQLELALSDSTYWKSLGEDPYFYLEPDPGTDFGPGWYRVDLLIETSNRRNIAKFYPDFGEELSEASAILLPYESRELATRVAFLPKKAHLIRFDPKEAIGCFRIFGLHIAPIAEVDAIDVMLRQIASKKIGGFTAMRQLHSKFEQQAREMQTTLAEQALLEYNELFAVKQGAINYKEWIETVEEASLPPPEQIATTIERLAYKPLISVIMPVFNTDENHLRSCIDSVLAQAYPRWELCIADDASPKPYVRKVIESYAVRDTRIHVVYRQKNGHISRASNSALDIARGEFVALLDHDDTLSEYALYFMVLAINENPDAQILYSDEDKIDLSGERFDPHFKSDWNPDLFYSQNYVSHLSVYRRDLLNRIQGFRPGVEGSQDHDLLLRCLPHVRPDQIIHIPRVLYHWRMVAGSTALAPGEKTYTTDAGIKVLSDYFAEQNTGVRVEAGLVPNTYRTRWPLPVDSPLVSLLIPTRDRKNLIESCVRSIIDRSSYQNYEIILLDNGSVDQEALEFFESIQKEDTRVTVLRYDLPFNFSAINNFGVRHSHGTIIGLINNDIEVITSGWLEEMISHALRPEIGCVGAKLYYGNDTIQHAGVICGLGGVAGHSHKYFARDAPGYFHRLILTQALSAVTAACLLVRRNVYDEVGGLDEENLPIAFNDVDFCLKVREAGYRNLWTPYAELYHYESISRGAEDAPQKQERFRREVEIMKTKWKRALEHDPYYSPNLTRDREDFSISGRA